MAGKEFLQTKAHSACTVCEDINTRYGIEHSFPSNGFKNKLYLRLLLRSSGSSNRIAVTVILVKGKTLPTEGPGLLWKEEKIEMGNLTRNCVQMWEQS
jgi:hypothetical protein